MRRRMNTPTFELEDRDSAAHTHECGWTTELPTSPALDRFGTRATPETRRQNVGQAFADPSGARNRLPPRSRSAALPAAIDRGAPHAAGVHVHPEGSR